MKWNALGGAAIGPSSALGRGALRALSWGYEAGSRLRSWAFDAGLRAQHRLPVPVLCVGNVVAGGTGKTPFIALLARRLLTEGRHPGVLARGYGGEARSGTGLNDEGLVLRHLLGERVPQHQEPDRVRGGRKLLAAHPEVDVLLLDDGFQHRRLRRDLDIVLLDSTSPFGGGAFLPRGRLRETPQSLRRAGIVVLTRTELQGEGDLDALRREVAALTDVPVVQARTQAQAWSGAFGVRPPSELEGVRLHLASGIGNPSALERFVRGLGAEIGLHHQLADHRGFDAQALALRAEQAAKDGAQTLLITRKDAVKYATLPDGVSVLDIELSLTAGANELWRAVRAALVPGDPKTL